MNPVPDRKKQRREYLKRRARLRTGYSVVVALLIGGALFSGATMIYFFALAWECSAKSNAILQCALCVGIALFLLWVFWQILIDLRRTVKLAKADAADLLYVPPVTLSNLPAEEILVRGAVQPSATSETLLRPATGEAKTLAEQLLRATNRAGSE